MKGEKIIQAVVVMTVLAFAASCKYETANVQGMGPG
jgi:hypothetical protein